MTEWLGGVDKWSWINNILPWCAGYKTIGFFLQILHIFILKPLFTPLREHVEDPVLDLGLLLWTDMFYCDNCFLYFWLKYLSKLDGVGPVNNGHFTYYLSHFVIIFFVFFLTKEKNDMLPVTCDTWHLTGGGRWTFSQNHSSLALPV